MVSGAVGWAEVEHAVVERMSLSTRRLDQLQAGAAFGPLG